MTLQSIEGLIRRMIFISSPADPEDHHNLTARISGKTLEDHDQTWMDQWITWILIYRHF